MAAPGKKPNYNSLTAFRDVMLIGKGQFSTVYRAKCIQDHTPVALKKIQVGGPAALPPDRLARLAGSADASWLCSAADISNGGRQSETRLHERN